MRYTFLWRNTRLFRLFLVIFLHQKIIVSITCFYLCFSFTFLFKLVRFRTGWFFLIRTNQFYWRDETLLLAERFLTFLRFNYNRFFWSWFIMWGFRNWLTRMFTFYGRYFLFRFTLFSLCLLHFTFLSFGIN